MNRLAGSFIVLCFFFAFSSTALAALAEHQVISHKVSSAPTLDGDINDAVWEGIKPDVIHDYTASVNFFMKSVYTDDKIYFCIQYKDTAENSFHKPWLWNKAKSEYFSGPHREDTFVFKWNMMDKPVNLSNFSEDLYTADVWYWKANRTNIAGYADDKKQILSDKKGKKATETVTASGKKRYLFRKSDAGKPAYKEIKKAPTNFTTPLVTRYEPAKPVGSRSDIEAKGVWKNGFWTIEFARKLNTGHSDDIQFDPKSGNGYLFGVSIYSLYGRPLVMDQPNRYGMGRISDPLELVFE